MSKEFEERLNEYLASWIGGRCSVKNLAYACYYIGRGDGAKSGKATPEHPTMHPDLVWLAFRPTSDFKLNCDRSKVLGFYRLNDRVAAELRSADGRMPASSHPRVFSLTEIEQARRHLAKPARHAEAITEGPTEFKKRARLHPDNDPHVDDYLLGLSKLPDYETWFETHGSERTVKHRLHPLQEATVNELYTMFRARLLDELHQAGVIGTKGGDA